MSMEMEITISADGTLKLDIKGVKGKSCLETAELFKKIIGPEASKRLKPEYYQTDAHILRNVRRSP